MKKVLGYILFTLAVLAFAAGTTLLVMLSKAQRHETDCSTIDIHFRDSLRFMDKDYALAFLCSRSEPCIGKRIEEIDLQEIENLFLTQSCIRSCESYLTDDGVLHIELEHRAPALLFHSGSKCFLADMDGNIFTSPCKCNPDVPKVHGEVTKAFDAEWIADMLAFVSALEKSPVCAGRVESYTVDDLGAVQLTLRGGTLAKTGQPGGYESTLRGLEHYFTAIEPVKGKGYYKTINLKYKGQIVCRKES